MRFKEINESVQGKYLYHVTFTKNVPSIVKSGLEQFHPSLWTKGDASTRYNDEAGVFAFEHPEDALKWCAKMEWEFRDNDPDISILRIHPSDDWDADPTQDIGLMFGKGRPMRSQVNIKASDVLDHFKYSEFGTPMSNDMTQDEWLAKIVPLLER